MQGVRKALYARLAGDTGAGSFTELAPGGLYYGAASQKTPPAGDYAVFKKIEGVPERTFKSTDGGLHSTRLMYMIKAAGRNGTKSGQDSSEDIMERVKARLEDYALPVTGKTVVYLRWERDIPDYTEQTDSGPVFWTGAYFRVEVE